MQASRASVGAVNMLQLPQGAKLVAQYHGALFSCMKGDPEGWRPITDGVVLLCMIHMETTPEQPYRIISGSHAHRDLKLKFTADTKMRRTRETFIQWHIKSSCLTYGMQVVTEAAAAKVMDDMQQGVHLARLATEERLRDAETQNRLSHLNRTGQTTQAYQILTDIAKNSRNQGKVMLKIALPDNQSAMLLQPPEASLAEVLRAVAHKRKLEPRTLGLCVGDGHDAVLSAQALNELDVASLATKEVTIVRLADILSSKKTKADAMRFLAAAAGSDTPATGAASLAAAADAAHSSSHTNPNSSADASAVAGENTFLQVHLPDGGQAMVKVPSIMSMGELLYYIAAKRDLDPAKITLADNSSGRKLISMKGTVAQSKRKKVHIVDVDKLPQRSFRRGSTAGGGGFGFSVRRGTLTRNRRHSEKPAGGDEGGVGQGIGSPGPDAHAAGASGASTRISISEPTLQSSTRNLGQTRGSISTIGSNEESSGGMSPTRAALQRVTSLLAEGVALDDTRLPANFVSLVTRANVAQLLHRDGTAERGFIMTLIEQHGGIDAVSAMDTASLRALFAPVYNFRKAGTLLRTTRGPAPQPKLRRQSTSGLSRLSVELEGSDSISLCSSQGDEDGKSRRRAPPPPPVAVAAAAGLAAAAVAARNNKTAARASVRASSLSARGVESMPKADAVTAAGTGLASASALHAQSQAQSQSQSAQPASRGSMAGVGSEPRPDPARLLAEAMRQRNDTKAAAAAAAAAASRSTAPPAPSSPRPAPAVTPRQRTPTPEVRRPMPPAPPSSVSSASGNAAAAMAACSTKPVPPAPVQRRRTRQSLVIDETPVAADCKHALAEELMRRPPPPQPTSAAAKPVLSAAVALERGKPAVGNGTEVASLPVETLPTPPDARVADMTTQEPKLLHRDSFGAMPPPPALPAAVEKDKVAAISSTANDDTTSQSALTATRDSCDSSTAASDRVEIEQRSTVTACDSAVEETGSEDGEPLSPGAAALEAQLAMAAMAAEVMAAAESVALDHDAHALSVSQSQSRSHSPSPRSDSPPPPPPPPLSAGGKRGSSSGRLWGSSSNGSQLLALDSMTMDSTELRGQSTRPEAPLPSHHAKHATLEHNDAEDAVAAVLTPKPTTGTANQMGDGVHVADVPERASVSYSVTSRRESRGSFILQESAGLGRCSSTDDLSEDGMSSSDSGSPLPPLIESEGDEVMPPPSPLPAAPALLLHAASLPCDAQTPLEDSKRNEAPGNDTATSTTCTLDSATLDRAAVSTPIVAELPPPVDLLSPAPEAVSAAAAAPETLPLAADLQLPADLPPPADLPLPCDLPAPCDDAPPPADTTQPTSVSFPAELLPPPADFPQLADLPPPMLDDDEEDEDYDLPPPAPVMLDDLPPPMVGLDDLPPPVSDTPVQLPAVPSVSVTAVPAVPAAVTGSAPPPPPPPMPVGGIPTVRAPSLAPSLSSGSSAGKAAAASRLVPPPTCAPRDELLNAIRQGTARARLRSVGNGNGNDNGAEHGRGSSSAAAVSMRRNTTVGVDLHSALMKSIDLGRDALRRVNSPNNRARDPEKRSSITSVLVNAMDARRTAISDEEDQEHSDGTDEWDDENEEEEDEEEAANAV